MKFYRARVLERLWVGEHVLLRYEWTGPEPEPGQFVGVHVAESLDPFVPRPFFVHDRGEGEISLLFKVRGRGTRLLATGGDEVLVSAPRGRGFGMDITLASSEPAALVGGGIWVAPLKLLSRRLRERGVSHDVYLESPPDVPEEYLLWLGEAHSGADLVPTDGSDGALGRALGGLDGYGAVYVSGDLETLRSIRRSRADSQLAVRERMACMDGSCYGCAVPVRSGEGVSYRRACVEGPVFRAGGLAW